MALTERQAAFAREYPKDWNRKAAMVRAGYGAKWASQNACRLTKNANIRAAVAAEVEALRGEFFVTRETQLVQLQRIMNDPECPHAVRLGCVKHVSELFGLTRDVVEGATETIVQAIQRITQEDTQGA